MKRRLLSLVLAASMVLGSINVAFADEANVPADSGVVAEAVEDAESEVTEDEVESDAAVEADVKNAKAGQVGPVAGEDGELKYWETTSPWKATVYGDCGGQTKIDNLGDPDYSEFKKDENGNTVFPYEVKEMGPKSVNIRMGKPSDNFKNGFESQGKISSSNDGRVFYYQKLTADDDFVLSATAHINGIANENNQVSFGAAIIDNVNPFVYDQDVACDSVNAGVRQVYNAKKEGDTTKFEYAFVRKGGEIKGFSVDKNSKDDVEIPEAGQDVKIVIKKSGDNYTMKYGNAKATYDGLAEGLTMADDIYVGFYAARCADITFSNINFAIAGQKVELPEWKVEGNGLNGQADKADKTSFVEEADNTKFTLSVDNDATKGNVGKLTDSEDSYSFYRVAAPGGVDFKFNTTIDTMAITTLANKNPQQAAVGVMIADEHYTKNEKESAGQGIYSNSLFVGLMTTKDKNSCNLVYRIRNGSEVIRNNISDDIICPVRTQTEPIDISIIKSGDNIKIKAGNYEAIDLPIEDVEGLFDSNQYIGYAVARSGNLTVTRANESIDVGTKKVKELSIISMPEKLNYYSTQKFDSTGLALHAVYVDGTEEDITKPDNYSLSGFDNAEGKYFTTPGNRTLKAMIGKAYVEIPVNVRPRKVTNLSVDYAPIYDTYYLGGKFNTVGLQITATYEDGNMEKLPASAYVLNIGGKVIADGSAVTADMVGEDVTVVVSHSAEDITINPNGITTAFHLSIKPSKLSGIHIYSREYKTTYYVGEEVYVGTEEENNIHVPGLTVYGTYKNGNETGYQYIVPSLYEVVDAATGKPFEKFTSADIGTKVARVQYKEDPSLFDTYEITILEPVPIKPVVISYPRLTYSKNEAFSTKDMEFGVLSSDNVVRSLCEDAYFFKNGTEYYKVYNKEVKTTDAEGKEVVYAAGDRVDVTEADVNAADFYIDLSAYNNENVGTTNVFIHINERLGAAAGATYNPLVWPITIVDNKDYVWKASLFGASSLGAAGQKDAKSSYINVAYNDGRTDALSDDTQHKIAPELMEGGKLDAVDKVDVVSWTGAGKISGDQDGIAYYYTSVDAKNNFTLSADITVNRYIRDVNELDSALKAKYNKYIAAGDSPQVALDKLRSGQEAFGIMARDVIPYAGGVDKDGNYLGNKANCMTPFPSDAARTEYKFTKADGTEVTYDYPADIYEAYINRIYVKDNENNQYVVQKQNVEAQFTSNIVIAGGCTDSTYPTDVNSSTYVKKTLMNRINIMTRRGVVSTAGGGKRVGIYSTTSKLPEPGEKYNIKLAKTNTGYAITTYDYQTGETVTKYSFSDVDDTENVLEIQDDENIYVGFFASRFADMTVENIELHESDPSTDPIITDEVNEAVAPKVTVNSEYYTTYTDFSLRLKSNSTKGVTGGVTSITQNGKTIVTDSILGNKEESYDVELVPNSVNRFSVVYYPNTSDNFLSYDPVILRFTVTHSDIADRNKIYVAPDGTPSGDGTRDNPVNFETALCVLELGGEIIMLDGTYVPTNVDLGRIEMPTTYSGAAGGHFKTMRAEEGAHPVIDLQHKFAGFDCDADYWYFKGFDVCNSKDNEKAFGLAGNHCVVEDCAFYNNGTTGFQVSRINSSDATIYDWPSYNVIKSCESFNNCDPSKNNADGFGAKLTVGYGNVFEDCISHHNLDDGWDCYTKINSGAIGALVLENCISYKQGYQLAEDGSDADFNATSGGNGFKLGGEGIYVPHMLKDCVAFYNKAAGIDTNNNPALIGRNVIAYDNYGYNFSLYSNTPNALKDASGKDVDPEGRVYKFNYDFKGMVSAGDKSIDRLSTVNYEINYANVAPNPIKSESNFIKEASYKVFLDKDEGGEDKNKYIKDPAKNSAGTELDESTFFKSTDPKDSYGTNQRYSRGEDGSFIHGDFLARVKPYTHEAADIVTLPDVLGGKGGVGLGTKPSVETTTQATTIAPINSGHGSGAGGSVKVEKYAPKQDEETTAEATTEATTEAPVLSASIKVVVDSKTISVDDKEFAMDVAPYIQSASNSTMVPLRFVAIAIAGGDVDSADSSDAIAWDAAAKTATITAGANTVVFTAGADTYVVNGNTLNISNQAVAEIVDGRMFVPFRTIGEALGADVSWDAVSKTAMYN